ncbi:TIR domain protein [compost metagenome]
MNFTHYDLGYVERGSIVVVTLSGSAANVRLMDSSNFSSFKAGRRHNCQGGLARNSPVRLAVPSSGRWHLCIDMQGLRGTVRTSVNVVPGSALRPLPTLNEAPLRSIPTLVREPANDLAPTDEAPDGRTFDVFISHASEDKAEVVRPLAEALRAGGLSVWYDEFELKIGDSLRRKIDRGLASSRFGIVVLSQAFFGRGWPEYELDGLVTRAVSGDQILLPIWHNVTKREVVGYSPSLADRLARSTATHTVEDIAAEIIEVVGARDLAA